MKLRAQKPHLLKIITPLQKSIVVKDDAIAWNNPWHFHPEIELLYCIKGKGTNFIGNCIRSIEEGELLLLGKNLPHTRQRDKEYYLENKTDTPSSVVVQFRENFLGDQFLRVQEFQPIEDLLNRSLRGLKFTGNILNEVTPKLLALKNKSGSSAILDLIAILDQLASTQEFIFLNSVNYRSSVNEKSAQLINGVYRYTVDNFRNPISLNDVASLTHHSSAAFCRYFKARTRKSYFQYLTEIRIAHACELLMEGNLDVSQVCFASGFNNLSHFHKQFKKHVLLTPSEYRESGRLKIPS
jgi:AraC-like DNA-binding protein